MKLKIIVKTSAKQIFINQCEFHETLSLYSLKIEIYPIYYAST